MQTLILPASSTDAKESMKTTERDAITSIKVKYMCLDYLYLRKISFCIFVQVVGIIMHVLLTGYLLCRGRSRGEMLGKGWEGSERV